MPISVSCRACHHPSAWKPTRDVVYVCHPAAPTAEEIDAALASSNPLSAISAAHRHNAATLRRLATLANVQRAMRWLSWLRRAFRDVTFVAPWIASILAGDDDTNPAQREAGLLDAEATIERCDGAVIVGGRIGSGGLREIRHGVTSSRVVLDGGPGSLMLYDLRYMGAEPPSHMPAHGAKLADLVEFKALIEFRAIAAFGGTGPGGTGPAR